MIQIIVNFDRQIRNCYIYKLFDFAILLLLLFFFFQKMSSHFEVNIFQKADTRSRQIVGHLIILNTQEQKNKKMAAQKKTATTKNVKVTKVFSFPHH